MKKLIVAAAGLMLVGAMVSNASAEAGMSFKGDARARGLYRDNYYFGELTDAAGNKLDDDKSQWQSRIRVIFQGESKGGAYANARVRFADSSWDGTQKTRALGEGSNIYTDWAYVGTPMGPLAVEAGLLPWNLTKWSQWDQRVDGLNVKYVNDMTTVMAFYQKMDEFDNSATDPVYRNGKQIGTMDLVDDDDMDRYGVYVNQKFDGGWGVVGAVMMMNDDQGKDASDRDGVAALAEVTGTIGNVAVLADAHWQEASEYGGGAEKRLCVMKTANEPFYSGCPKISHDRPHACDNGAAFYPEGRIQKQRENLQGRRLPDFQRP